MRTRRLFRRLRRRAGEHAPLAAAPGVPPTGLGEPSSAPADEAELDELRGELVRELDRMASRQVECSAGLRRIDL